MGKIKKLLVVGLTFIFLYSCYYANKEDLIKNELDYTINLRWIKAYENENWNSIQTGIIWHLSYLGAELPKGSLQQAIIRKDETLFSIDFSKVGFSPSALKALSTIINYFKQSEEYNKMGGIDLGRFVMLTTNSSYHYYEITGADKNISAFKSKFEFDNKIAVVKFSGVSKSGQRIIQFSKGQNYDQIGIIATQGEGSVINGTFQEHEFEVFDVMKNGQLRYIIYDLDGNLISHSDSITSKAGKTAKCLWCHETKFMPAAINSLPMENFISNQEVADIINDKMNIIVSYRNNLDLNSDMNFKQMSNHTFQELLYLSFIEPSAERIALEWQMTVEEVKVRLKTLSAHPHPEFKFLGEQLYYRNEIEKFSPYYSLPIPDSPRETSSYEPNFFN